jgi:hypothetical protein
VGGTVLGNATVNQRVNPAGYTEGDRPFSNIGTVTITGDTLVVELTNGTGLNGAIIADAIRIERIG